MNCELGDKYRLLESIFSCEEDIAFLESEPGYHPWIGGRHRAEKRKLAFLWIRELQRDFNELYEQGKLILVHSNRDRSDLLKALLRLRFTFRIRVFFLKLRLRFTSPALDEIRILASAFEHMICYCRIIEDDATVLPAN